MTTASESSTEEVLAEPVALRRLYRSNSKKVVAGICGGLGDYFAVDPVWFRFGFVVLTIGGGSGILIYLLMWLIVPPEPEGYAAPASERGAVGGAAIAGMVLMIVGAISLANTAAPWLGQYVWPIVFLIGGLALILGGVNRDTHR